MTTSCWLLSFIALGVCKWLGISYLLLSPLNSFLNPLGLGGENVNARNGHSQSRRRKWRRSTVSSVQQSSCWGRRDSRYCRPKQHNSKIRSYTVALCWKKCNYSPERWEMDWYDSVYWSSASDIRQIKSAHWVFWSVVGITVVVGDPAHPTGHELGQYACDDRHCSQELFFLRTVLHSP